MKTEILHKKLERYLNGESMPAEIRQIQTWLSVPNEEEKQLTKEEKDQLGADILAEIKEATAYPLFYPGSEKQWWQKAVAAFF
ncbi:MAG: hypothetical protein EOO05_15455 [Chitinophagaceae bacterium]|nr:MAG: hypothetical protein EOO05_15455 [Chitinophagaceae bacterium]